MYGTHYSIKKIDAAYFLTCTTVDWVDIFTRSNHKMAIVDSLKYCQEHKGLNIYAWCLMSNHLHMIVSAEPPFILSETIRDFKKFTSKKIAKQVIEEPESRRHWLRERFIAAGLFDMKIKNYKLWQYGNHAIEVFSPAVTWQKINYIHQNPVRALIVQEPQEYLFSSARNYFGRESLLNVHCIPQMLDVIS